MRLGDSQEWRYTSQDIALLGAIRDLLNQGNTIGQVRTQLSSLREAPKNGSAPSQALAVTHEVGRALVEVVHSQRATITALEGQIELLRAETARLQIELERQTGAERDQAELDRQADRYQVEIERLRADIERQRVEIAQQQTETERQRGEAATRHAEIERQQA